MNASAGNKTSHPVEIECPVCLRRLRLPLHTLSAGARFSCHGCQQDISIATPLLRQLLREIDRDLCTPDDLPIVLRPSRATVAKTDRDQDPAKPA